MFLESFFHLKLSRGREKSYKEMWMLRNLHSCHFYSSCFPPGRTEQWSSWHMSLLWSHALMDPKLKTWETRRSKIHRSNPVSKNQLHRSEINIGHPESEYCRMGKGSRSNLFLANLPHTARMPSATFQTDGHTPVVDTHQP